jgi:hypothetical protein
VSGCGLHRSSRPTTTRHQPGKTAALLPLIVRGVASELRTRLPGPLSVRASGNPRAAYDGLVEVAKTQSGPDLVIPPGSQSRDGSEYRLDLEMGRDLGCPVLRVKPLKRSGLMLAMCSEVRETWSRTTPAGPATAGAVRFSGLNTKRNVPPEGTLAHLKAHKDRPKAVCHMSDPSCRQRR